MDLGKQVRIIEIPLAQPARQPVRREEPERPEPLPDNWPIKAPWPVKTPAEEPA